MDKQIQARLEIDQISKEEWSFQLRSFADATFFQTWEYGDFKWGAKNVSRAILKLPGRTIAAAQVRISDSVPGIKYAYIAYGPLWRTWDSHQEDEANLDLMLRALADEYVRKRGCSLRIFCPFHSEHPLANEIRNRFFSNGFLSTGNNSLSLFLDISPALDKLRANLRRKWRLSLRYAEEANLTVHCNNLPEHFEACLSVYKKMHERKGFKEHVSMDELCKLHALLPEALKFKILSVGEGERIDACVICSIIGDTALLLMAATEDRGLHNYASYLAYWEMLKILHNEGVRWFDFRGIDPQGNPGGYTFKTGISGKSGFEAHYLGDFMLYRSTASRLLMTGAEKLRSRFHALQMLPRRIF